MIKHTVILLLFVSLVFGGTQGKGVKREINRRRNEEAQETSIVEQPYYTHQAFRFGYDVKDQKHGHQYRQEEGNHKGIVKGRYGYKDPFGIYRHVEYIADALGFRARVRSNEPGLGSQHPAHVEIIKTGPPPPIFLHTHPIIGVAHSKPSVVAVRAPDAIIAKATEDISTSESSQVVKAATEQKSKLEKNSRAYGQELERQRLSELQRASAIFTNPLLVQQSNQEPTKSKFWFESQRVQRNKQQQRAKENQAREHNYSSKRKNNLQQVKIVKVESPQSFPYFLPHIEKHGEFNALSHPPPKTIDYPPGGVLLLTESPKQQHNPYSDTIVLVETAPSTLPQQNPQNKDEKVRTVSQQAFKPPKYSGFDIPFVVVKDHRVEPVPSSEFLPSFRPKEQKQQISNDPFVIVKAAKLGKDLPREGSGNDVQPIPAIVFDKDASSPVYEHAKVDDKLDCQFNCESRSDYGESSENKEIVHQPQYVQLPCNLAH